MEQASDQIYGRENSLKKDANTISDVGKCSILGKPWWLKK